MPSIIVRPAWWIPESLVTPEKSYAGRRQFLKQLGLGAGLALGGGSGWLTGHAAEAAADTAASGPATYPAKRNPDFNPKLDLTPETIVGRYNNFYEFSTNKERVSKLVDRFVINPWEVDVGGLCENPMTLEMGTILRQFPLEERIYRFRCVEAWAMIVPWTGFPLAKLIEKAKPKPAAKFVRFITANRPDQMPGLARLPDYPWPYTEGLRLDEAMNPLTLVATGLYGKPLPKQNGAPLRIVVPWKYGYKSIKSVVRIEFVATQPSTLWETLQPQEYPFESNVDPGVPHPRWSQARERQLGTGDYVPTLKYNGYEAQVASLYRRA